MDVSGEAVNGGGNGAEKEAGSTKLTEDQLSMLAVKLADHWEALVPKFGLPQEEVCLICIFSLVYFLWV